LERLVWRSGQAAPKYSRQVWVAGAAFAWPWTAEEVFSGAVAHPVGNRGAAPNPQYTQKRQARKPYNSHWRRRKPPVLQRGLQLR